MLEDFWAEIKTYRWVGLFCLVLICFLAAFCSSPEKDEFAEQAQVLCKSLDSRIAYINEERKVVICE